MSISALHKAAREYAAAGLAVFPVKRGQKVPAINGGHTAATTDLARIDRWWGKGAWNIGLPPEACGWVVVDAEHDADPAYVAKLHATATYTVSTPRGGWHFYFEGSLPSTVGKLAPRVDTRGQGGYVLVAPSTVDGKVYRVLRQAEVVPLPEWLKLPERAKPLKNGHDFEVDTPANISRAVDWLKRQPEVKEKHGADARTYEVACAIRDLGLSPDRVFEVMLEHYKIEPRDQRLTGFLQTKIANAFEYATNAPGMHAAPSSAKLASTPAVAEAALAQTQCRLVTRLAADIKPEKLLWLWPDRFPRGKVSLLAGEGKKGKTTLLLDIAARISTGANWPDGGKAPQGRVIYLSAEDTPADTLIPRLMASNADLTQVRLVDCVRAKEGDGLLTFNLAEDLAELDKLLTSWPGVQLVIFDPINSYFGKGTDTYRNTEVRAILEPLVRVASNHRIAVIGNTHLTKASKGKATNRILDSVGIQNTVRASYMVIEDSEDKHRRLFLPAAANLGPPMEGLAFTIAKKFVTSDQIVGTHVEWQTGAVETTVDEAVAANDDRHNKPAPRSDEAEAFLRAYLAKGPKSSAEVWTAAGNHGLAPATVRRVANRIGVVSSKLDMDAGWIMSLPK